VGGVGCKAVDGNCSKGDQNGDRNERESGGNDDVVRWGRLLPRTLDWSYDHDLRALVLASTGTV